MIDQHSIYFTRDESKMNPRGDQFLSFFLSASAIVSNFILKSSNLVFQGREWGMRKLAACNSARNEKCESKIGRLPFVSNELTERVIFNTRIGVPSRSGKS